MRAVPAGRILRMCSSDDSPSVVVQYLNSRRLQVLRWPWLNHAAVKSSRNRMAGVVLSVVPEWSARLEPPVMRIVVDGAVDRGPLMYVRMARRPPPKMFEVRCSPGFMLVRFVGQVIAPSVGEEKTTFTPPEVFGGLPYSSSTLVGRVQSIVGLPTVGS